MERDMDLVRKILMAFEAEPSGSIKSSIEIVDYSDEQIE